VRTLLDARLRITCPAFVTVPGGDALRMVGTPDPPETINLAKGGSGRGWQVLVVKDMPTEPSTWVLHKLLVKPAANPPAFYLTSAYDLTVGAAKQLWIHETVWRVIGEHTLAAPIEFPEGAALRMKLGLEDSYLAERLAFFHGPVDLQVALIGEEKR
jgi:hypothetical protein